MPRRTKIVATYGPAIDSDEAIARVLEAGADVIRLNFSHGDHAGHGAAIARIRAAADRAGRAVAILQDLRGPKVRLGVLPGDGVDLAAGATVLLAAAETTKDPRALLPVTGYPTLAQDVVAGQTILLDDGAVRLRAAETTPEGVRCEVLVGGRLSSHKGINFPETRLASLETITAKDEEDLRFGLSQEVDWIALSFVRSAADITRLKERIDAHGADTPVIAKIEKKEALADLDAIVTAADGIMVARGDLGVETPLEEVALRQKEIIRECNRQGRIVITATQMLESMITHASPTRAEVSDVSNAILDGSDAVMLSGETAVGAHAVDAVAIMSRIAERTEAMLQGNRALAHSPYLDQVADAVAHAVCQLAQEIEADAILCFTRAGFTARLVSRYRPRSPVVALSPDLRTVRRLAPVWGVRPILVREEGGEAPLDAALREAQEAGIVRKGEKVIVAAGVSPGALWGQPNLIRVEIL